MAQVFRALREAMSKVRTFEAADLDDVANLFQRLLRKTSQPANHDLRSYFRQIFLDNARPEPAFRSRVHLRDDGSVSGFIGVLPVSMQFKDRQILALDCGSFVSDDRDVDPFAGARLLRDVLSGPQDLSFTETANDISTEMWKSMRATVLGSYSLGWLRILRPASFAIEAATNHMRALKVMRPFGQAFDGVLSRALGPSSWLGYERTPGKADAFLTEPISDSDFAELLPGLLTQYAIRPVWSNGQLEAMLQHATRKRNYGERHQRAVKNRGGKIIGLYLFYGNKGDIGRTVQVVSEPGLESIVIDCLLRDASALGLVAIRGASQPSIIQAMIGKKCAFVPSAATIVHTHDRELLEALKSGQAFINGLVGEGWTRFIGDRFE